MLCFMMPFWQPLILFIFKSSSYLDVLNHLWKNHQSGKHLWGSTGGSRKNKCSCLTKSWTRLLLHIPARSNCRLLLNNNRILLQGRLVATIAWKIKLKAHLLCFIWTIYYRAISIQNMSEVFCSKYQTDHPFKPCLIPLYFSPVTKVLILGP